MTVVLVWGNWYVCITSGIRFSPFTLLPSILLLSWSLSPSPKVCHLFSTIPPLWIWWCPYGRNHVISNDLCLTSFPLARSQDAPIFLKTAVNTVVWVPVQAGAGMGHVVYSDTWFHSVSVNEGDMFSSGIWWVNACEPWGNWNLTFEKPMRCSSFSVTCPRALSRPRKPNFAS